MPNLELAKTYSDGVLYVDFLKVLTPQRRTMSKISKEYPGIPVVFHYKESCWRFLDGNPHCDDQPAFTQLTPSFYKYTWYRHGVIHRDQGPAKICRRTEDFRTGSRTNYHRVVTLEWYQDGHKHRHNDRPAFIQYTYSPQTRLPDEESRLIDGKICRSFIVTRIAAKWYTEGKLEHPASMPPMLQDENVLIYYDPDELTNNMFGVPGSIRRFEVDTRSYCWGEHIHSKRTNGPASIRFRKYGEDWEEGKVVRYDYDGEPTLVFCNDNGTIANSDIEEWDNENPHRDRNILGNPYFLDPVDELDFITRFMR